MLNEHFLGVCLSAAAATAALYCVSLQPKHCLLLLRAFTAATTSGR